MLDSRRNVALACALSALAGYVDGIGFLHLGGLFVSFMSGNSTRLGVSLAAGDWHDAADAFVLIALFICGAAAGSLIVLGCRSHRQPWVLLAEASLLGVAALAYGLACGCRDCGDRAGDGTGKRGIPDRRRRGIGLTYVTGTLVKVGQLAGVALKGGPRWDWLPNLLLWVALVAGAVAGAAAYHRINLAAIWFAAVVALAHERDRRRGNPIGTCLTARAEDKWIGRSPKSMGVVRDVVCRR